MRGGKGRERVAFRECLRLWPPKVEVPLEWLGASVRKKANVNKAQERVGERVREKEEQCRVKRAKPGETRCGGMRSYWDEGKRIARERTNAVNERGRENGDKRDEGCAESADRWLLRAMVKPWMSLAFDNYSRSVLCNV